MDFLNGSFRVGRLFGITIRVHILFVIWIAWRLIASGDGWQFHAAFLGMLFGIVLLHEFGHCFGARSVGGFAENILMWPLGGLAYAHAPMTPWAQFVTVASGPLVNVGFCVLAGVVHCFFGDVKDDPLFPQFQSLNSCLIGFHENILPVCVLDFCSH